MMMHLHQVPKWWSSGIFSSQARGAWGATIRRTSHRYRLSSHSHSHAISTRAWIGCPSSISPASTSITTRSSLPPPSTMNDLGSYRAALREAVDGGRGIIEAVTMFERLDRGVAMPGFSPDNAMVEEVLTLCLAHSYTRPLLPTLRRWLPRGLDMDLDTYLAATKALCRKQRTSDVVAFLALLRKHHVQGRDQCYAMAVNMVDDQPTTLRILMEWVEDDGIPADDALLCAVLQQLTNWQRWGPRSTSVKEIVDTLATQGGVDSKQFKKSLSLGLKYFGNHGLWEEALGSLKTMLKRGDELNLHVATSALVACARAGEEEACKWIFERILEGGVPVDDRVLTAMVMLPCQRGDWEGIIRALGAFKEYKVEITTWALSVAIRGLGQCGAWPVALWLYEEAVWNGQCDQAMVRSLVEALPHETGHVHNNNSSSSSSTVTAIAVPLLQHVIDTSVFPVWKRPWVADLHGQTTRMAQLILPVILEQAARMQEEGPRHDLHIISGWGSRRPRKPSIGSNPKLDERESSASESLKDVVQRFVQEEMGCTQEWLDKGTIRVKAQDINSWWQRIKADRQSR